ncbi:MAG: aryl-sulfate sulfotransferase [Bryobacteraceae bacterium]
MKYSLFTPAFYLALTGASMAGAMSVTVTPSIPSPAPVGTMVTFNTAVSDASPKLWYRFRVRPQNGDYQTVRDFGPVPSLQWTASAHEGAFDVEVTVRDLASGQTERSSALFQFTPLGAAAPVVSPTSHPLVFLYSAPACESLKRMRVEFVGPDGIAQYTAPQDCGAGLSMNFYLAGLRARSTYAARYLLVSPDGSSERGDEVVKFTTGTLPVSLYDADVKIPSVDSSDRILLGSPFTRAAVAHDLAGNVVWYGPSDLAYITRVEAGGYFWGLFGSTTNDPALQLVRKVDLTGMTVLETNAARVSEQLAAMGKRPITAFHHEAVPLPNGRLAVLGGVEEIMTDVQGPGPIDIVGDMIVVLDKDMNVVWSWDAFDFLDVRRKAVLDEKCPQSSCPPMLLAKTGNDWTHANSIQVTHDGNLILSMRHQDWLVKIDYADTWGSGRILWRLGKDGDFTVNSNDPSPWFSHQHDAGFEAEPPLFFSANRYARMLPRLMVFDNGNTRVAAQGGGNSRGQVYEIDESARQATLVLNADLGVYAFAVGSAEKLTDGNYHFDAGYIRETAGVTARAFEVTPDGTITYDAGANTPLYRSFRLADMYTPQ